MKTKAQRNAFTGLQERIEQLEKEVKEHERQKVLEPFIKEFLQNLGTILAYTPRSEWPREAKIAFEHARKKMPTAAEYYDLP